MKKIIVHEFITLDGVIQAPGSPTEDTDGGFTHGGWTLPYWHDEIGAHFGQIFAEADTLLLGRKTWQTHGEAFEPDPGQRSVWRYAEVCCFQHIENNRCVEKFKHYQRRCDRRDPQAQKPAWKEHHHGREQCFDTCID